MIYLCFLLLFGVIAPSFVFLAEVPPFLQRRKAFIMEFFENCDNEVFPVMYRNFSFIRNGSTLHVSGEEIVDRDLRNPLSYHVRIERCKDKSDLNTCEYFTNLHWNDYCAAMTLIPLLKTISQTRIPPPSCPMKKNQYHVNDAKVPLSWVEAFLAQGKGGTRSLIKLCVTMLEGSHRISCINRGMRVADVRIRS